MSGLAETTLISVRQSYKDKQMRRERGNKEKVDRRNDKPAAVGPQGQGLSSSRFTYKLRSAGLCYVLKDLAHFSQVLKENRVS